MYVGGGLHLKAGVTWQVPIRTSCNPASRSASPLVKRRTYPLDLAFENPQPAPPHHPHPPKPPPSNNLARSICSL